MFCSGTNGSTPSSRAVIGISCIRPIAPLRDSASGLKADSVSMIARTIAASTWWRFAYFSISASNAVGQPPAPRRVGAGAFRALRRATTRLYWASR